MSLDTKHRWSLESRPRKLNEAFEFANTGGVTHLAEGLGLDLADPLAGFTEKSQSRA